MDESPIATRWKDLKNLRMAEKLTDDIAIDLSQCKVTDDGDYILEGNDARDAEQGEFDFCDAKKEAWIWSIGKHKTTGQILASTTSKFYGHPDYKCLWLR